MDEQHRGHTEPGDEVPVEPEQDLDAPPRAFLPTTPFGDAKPYAGSTIDPSQPARPSEAPDEIPDDR